uniref:Pyrokinin-4 n=3 Tax=Mantophasmatodea TaxID=192413 RepID=PPK4_PACBA|nr:RecName: Full=Pyrokinin-4; Short=PK-4 [Pachyphasma brandbergense]
AELPQGLWVRPRLG